MGMLGARISALRRKQGLTQAQLGQALGVSASAVGMYEQGRREPGVTVLVEMARLFGVSTDYLLTGKAVTAADEQGARQALLQALAHAETREHQPFSRQELAAMFAALLLET
jgi:transcriptional regulator with XRE-family HTH domain